MKIYLILLSIVLTGCNTISDNYPNFKQNSADIQTIDIIVDIGVTEDIEGDDDKYDIEEHKTMINNLLQKIKLVMQNKGYPVRNISKSVGLLLNSKRKEKLLTYTDNNLTPVKEDLIKLITELDAANNDEKLVKNSNFLNSISSADRVLILSYYGRDINDAKTFASGFFTTALSLVLSGGLYASTVVIVDYFHGGFYMINPKNNQLVLSQKLHGKKIEPTFDEISQLIPNILKDIPSKK